MHHCCGNHIQNTTNLKVSRSKSTRSYKEHATVPRVISSTSDWDLAQSPKFNYHSLKLANLVQAEPIYTKPGQTKILNSENGSSDSGMGTNSMSPEMNRAVVLRTEVSV